MKPIPSPLRAPKLVRPVPFPWIRLNALTLTVAGLVFAASSARAVGLTLN